MERVAGIAGVLAGWRGTGCGAGRRRELASGELTAGRGQRLELDAVVVDGLRAGGAWARRRRRAS